MALKDITDKQVCEAYAESEKQRGKDGKGKCDYPYIILQRMTGQSEKICYKAMERTCDRGFIEYGVSLRTGWLTEEGNKLLSGE